MLSGSERDDNTKLRQPVAGPSHGHTGPSPSACLPLVSLLVFQGLLFSTDTWSHAASILTGEAGYSRSHCGKTLGRDTTSCGLGT